MVCNSTNAEGVVEELGNPPVNKEQTCSSSPPMSFNKNSTGIRESTKIIPMPLIKLRCPRFPISLTREGASSDITAF